MPSPFPGMNPYLEQDSYWQDFHVAFLPALRERLVPQVRTKYIVLLEEHLFIHELPFEESRLLGRADLSLTERPHNGAGTCIGGGVLEAPTHVQLTLHDVERVPYLEIRDRQNRELITVLELLSPSNKRAGGDREQYVAKREEILKGNVHFVEIDLLRGGRPMPMSDRPDCDYSVLVSRVEDRLTAGFWPINLRDRLPKIPIPLRPSDADAKLDLQEVLHRVYNAAGYEDFIYTGTPQPPLSAEAEAWAQQFIPHPAG